MMLFSQKIADCTHFHYCYVIGNSNLHLQVCILCILHMSHNIIKSLFLKKKLNFVEINFYSGMERTFWLRCSWQSCHVNLELAKRRTWKQIRRNHMCNQNRLTSETHSLVVELLYFQGLVNLKKLRYTFTIQLLELCVL